MLSLVTALALMVSQNSAIPGPDDATFEQRWQNMVVKQILRKQTEEIMQPEPKIERSMPEKRVRHHRRARVANGCRFGHKVYHGRSWRCRR